MTISSTENRVSLNGNGVTVDFSFPYRFLDNDDLKVYVDGDLQTITTDYTVVGAGLDGGGTVTFGTAPPAGIANVVILRDPARTQELDLVENDPLPVEEVEKAFDLLTMIAQRLADLQGRSLTLDDADPAASLTLPLSADRAGNLLGFDDNGDLQVILSSQDIADLNTNVTAILDQFNNLNSLPWTSINFSTTGTTDAVGRLTWNDTDGTLHLGLKGGQSVLQLGQETMIRVVNKTGAPIANGEVIRLTGAQGNRVTAVKAQADSAANTDNTIAVATEDIGNNDEGFCTVLGLVRNIDTSAFTEGDPLYLSAATAGALTNVAPTSPNWSIQIGWCVRDHASLGSIFVNVDSSPPLLDEDDMASDSATAVPSQQSVKTYVDSASGAIVGTSRNLVIKNNSATPNSKMDIAADDVVLKTAGGTAYLASAVTVTVDIAASGANGLDTGTEANSTWYYLWLIYNGTTVASLISTSSTAPTMPSGYTYRAMLGAVYNDSSGNFVLTHQVGRKASTLPQVAVSGGTATSYTSASLTAIVPPIAKYASGRMRLITSSGTSSRADVASDAADFCACSTGGSSPSGTANIYSQWQLPLVTAQTIYYRVTVNSTTVEVTGWEV